MQRQRAETAVHTASDHEGAGLLVPADERLGQVDVVGELLERELASVEAVGVTSISRSPRPPRFNPPATAQSSIAVAMNGRKPSGNRLRLLVRGSFG
ncbi:MAG TPA: hypothetical protein VF695_13900 [Sphingomonas sp.]|jgi:hypothetical protein